MLPEGYLTRMQNLLGEDYAAFLGCYDQPADVGLRVNTLKLTPTQFDDLVVDIPALNDLTPTPWISAGYTLPPDSRPGKHPYYAAGLYYLQDPAAQAVAELLAPKPGERVLDLSAAPGGKTTHIAARMAGCGLLVANDIHSGRVRDLARNIERWGARNVVITNETPARLANHFEAYFDRVLVDAPCSGEGMFRKDPAIRREWTPQLVERFAFRQDTILKDAARLVCPGGLLVYATCTFAPQEDEGTMARFLSEQPDFELVSAPGVPGFDHGRPDWLEGADPSLKLERTVRLWPHKALGEGHFIGILHRKSSSYQPARPPSARFTPAPLPKDVAQDFAKFAEETLRWQPPGEQLALIGSYLYLLPHGLPDIHGLNVFHWGWWLGTSKKNRFEPSHALAMGLQAEDFRQIISFSSADSDLMRYLRGEVLQVDGPNGWVMMTVDGFTLGWAKRVRGRLKSHLPRWLRSM